MTCRTCKFLEVPASAAGKIIPRKGNVYYCLSPVPKTAHLLPASITEAYGYREPTERDRRRMAPDEGTGCPLYEPRL